MRSLFRVTLRGFSSSHYKVSYVIATDSFDAYEKVRSFLDDKKLGFEKDRALDSVELVAENKQYPECETILYL